jgi:hypothetical protein
MIIKSVVRASDKNDVVYLALLIVNLDNKPMLFITKINLN